MRERDVSAMTADDLQHAKRELAASLALVARPDSPIRATIQTQLSAIDAAVAKRERRVRLCSCGFATTDAAWMDGHLSERPSHHERRAEPMSEAWTA